MRLQNFSKGLKVTLKDNTSAYGYSVSITGSYALLSSLQTSPTTVSQIFAAAAGAACAFAVVELATLVLFRNMNEGQAERTKLLARLMSAASVGSSMGAAALGGLLLHGRTAWFAGTFAATCLFVLFDAVELGIVESSEHDRS